MDPNSSLEQFQADARQRFNAKIEHDLISKKRQADIRRYFELTCRKKFPTLTILWKNAHIGMIKSTIRAYPPEKIKIYIDHFVKTAAMHDRGLSFDGFYHYIQKIALDVASEQQRIATVTARKAIAEPLVTSPTSTEETELEKFKRSPFFKRMPKGFQEKLTQEKPQGS